MESIINSIITDKQFSTAQKWNNDISILDIIGINEMNMSNILCWLLNPRQAHNLGDMFIKSFLRAAKISAYNTNLTFLKDWNMLEISSYSFGDFVAETEVHFSPDKMSKCRIDILMVDKVNKIAIIIENKYGAKQHGDQISNYEKSAQELTKYGYETYCVYLDINGDKPDNHNWIPLDYDWIAEFIHETLKSKSVTQDVETLFKSLLYTISDEVTYEDLFDYFNGTDEALRHLSSMHFSSLNTLKSSFTTNFRNYFESKYESFSEFSYRNRALLETLLELGTFSLLQNHLESKFPRISSEIEGNKTKLNICNWDKLMSEPDSYWPVYIEVKQNDSNLFNVTIYVKSQYANRDDLVKTLKERFFSSSHQNNRSSTEVYTNIDSMENLINRTIYIIEEINNIVGFEACN